ncbi:MULTISPECIES: transcription-repair coupling factor [unclassified Arsukibacterium]|uniref:transcription-repair coupling factor n=1 Tax=unclassified Arsukibacterium TaxID=2635278 RepID=UPI0025C21B3D|nr:MULTISPECIES: transcription-repair coupling factor [unclassified Arsukibacterium]|tara:strand:- start:148701 stop:152180 length:3480 start_codon:yes stop_codon:yes gene_type:complete
MSFIKFLPRIKRKQDQIGWGQLHGAALPYAITQLVQTEPGVYLLIVPDTPSALRLEQELAVFFNDSAWPVLTLPDWETLPYDVFSPHQDIISQRLKTLYQLPRLTQGLVIVPVSTLLLKISQRNYLEQASFLIEQGQQVDLTALKLQLTAVGYRAVDQVMEHGEFSARGSLLDLFPMGCSSPFRIDFFDNEVDGIRTFDPDNQRSLSQVNAIELLPAHEFPTDKAAIERFRLRYRERFAARNEKESLYQQVTQGIFPAGIEYYLPLFAEQTASLFSFLPPGCIALSYGDIEHSANQFWHELKRRYHDRAIDTMRPILQPQELYLQTDELFSELNNFSRLKLSRATLPAKTGQDNAPVAELPELNIQHQLKQPLSLLSQFLLTLKQQNGRAIFFVESEGRRESLHQLFNKAGIRAPEITRLADFANSDADLVILVGALEQGAFITSSPPLALISENELFGQKISQRRRRKKSQQVSSDTIIRNLAELSEGQPVVHLQHGVGRYQGLQVLDAAGISAEFVTIEYAGSSKLYVPVSSLHLLSRYSGSDQEHAPLHKLGNDTWEKARRKAAEKIRDVAAELLDVYAQRAAHQGYAFKIEQEQYAAFADSFPFEETADQQDAITAVLNDMQTPQPMDRLVCGDVGFGKTEVAMRAAFIAVNDAKQVAILVPTTLLAQQHFENFKDRFANWPVRVEVLSRFVSQKQQKAILEDVANGKVDILIGTHKLLQDDIKLHDLGLLIVDEEHRFGVRQKEKIKALRANIDILTLTATPIPRTLNMSMSGMRDLSIIATPPARRLAVKTFVREFEAGLLREAVMREILRGGQVYFLHNDVATIEKMASDLAELVPEANIAIAHGQLRERDLERIMADFYHQRFNLLLCSTIIETGIDVPTANTIIINRADNFGLAQLHQLRGRVGRSHHQAYAYLLTPPPKRLSKDAEKRLEAISSLEDLGAGFALATHDLEIRGAGELLGDEQSGQIETIGFTLYMDMLEEAVTALKEGRQPSLDMMLSQQSEIDLKLPALLPDSYIPDVNLRLSFYKKLASAKDESELDDVQVELIDRFGLLPDAAKNLVKLTEFKQQAQQLGIKRIEANAKGGLIEFADKTRVAPAYIIGLIQQQSRIFKLEGGQKLRFTIASPDAKDRLSLVANMLADFSQHQLEKS